MFGQSTPVGASRCTISAASARKRAAGTIAGKPSTIGGRADESAELGAILGPAVPYAEIADVVEDIAAAYLELRARPDELFVDTVKRIGVDPFRERVYAAR